MTARRFELHRHTDVSGVSGVGVVAEGLAFTDGAVVLRWRSDWPTSVVFHDRGIEAVTAVLGHDGATEIVWLDADTAEYSCKGPHGLKVTAGIHEIVAAVSCRTGHPHGPFTTRSFPLQTLRAEIEEWRNAVLAEHGRRVAEGSTL